MVAVSATITANLAAVAAQVTMLRAGPDAHKRKVLVGDYPFNVDKNLWRRVGADGTAPDGRHAVMEANRLLVGTK